MYNPKSKTFYRGKHEGKTAEEVLEEDPRYLKLLMKKYPFMIVMDKEGELKQMATQIEVNSEMPQVENTNR